MVVLDRLAARRIEPPVRQLGEPQQERIVFRIEASRRAPVLRIVERAAVDRKTCFRVDRRVLLLRRRVELRRAPGNRLGEARGLSSLLGGQIMATSRHRRWAVRVW